MLTARLRTKRRLVRPSCPRPLALRRPRPPSSISSAGEDGRDRAPPWVACPAPLRGRTARHWRAGMNAASAGGTEAPVRAGPHKVELVDRLTHQLGRATSAIVTDYRGRTVAQPSALRGPLPPDETEHV